MQFLHQLMVFGALFAFCLADRKRNNSTHGLSKCGGKEKASALLDVCEEFITKARNLYPNCIEKDPKCGQKEKSLAFLDVASNVISEVKKTFPNLENSNISSQGSKQNCSKQVERPIDCTEILRSGKNASGIYTIWPRNRLFTNRSLTVYCDMDTAKGGWTVIQRRGKYKTPKDFFYKNWESYKNGFGNPKEEFWLGNDNIFAISNQANYTIRFDLRDSEGKPGFAEYNTFWIEEENANYTLHIHGYRGNVGDSMHFHDGSQFSTKDRKNDRRDSNRKSCAVEEQGAWWYGSCGFANLNSLYQPGIESDKGCYWFSWSNSWMGLSRIEMKLRSSV